MYLSNVSFSLQTSFAENKNGGKQIMELNEFIMSWLGLLLDFFRLVGLDSVADEIANKIVMPL